jgi:hypothetical protein
MSLDIPDTPQGPVSHVHARRIVFASFVLFLPIFFWVGIGAGIVPLSVLFVMGLSSLRMAPMLGGLLLFEAVFYLAVEYAIARILVRFIYCPSMHWLRLATLVAIPFVVSLVPIYTIAGMQDAAGPFSLYRLLWPR